MGLVRWWPFTANTNDKTVNKANLQSVSGVTIVEAGKLGKCASFSGSGSSGKTPNPLIGKNVFSICCWIKPNTPNAWSDIFSFETSEFRLEKSSTDSYIIYGTSSVIAAGTTAFDTIPNATWTHIALISDGTKWYTYKNGVLNKSGDCMTNVISGANFFIGQRGASNAYWAGSINDFRIYDHALSVKEVKEISKGLMLHYDLNNRINTAIRDSSGFENHAQEVSGCAPTYVASESGMGSGCYLFKNNAKQSNGLYQHITSNSTVYIPEQGTLSYYIKYDTTNYAENADNKYAVGYANFCSMNNPSALGMIYYYDASNYTTTTTSNNSKDGNWHMHTISWNKETKLFKNYLDGVLIQSATVTAFQHPGTFRNFYIGCAWGTSYGGHSGFLDDIRVYATQLSDTDVKELYEVKGSISKNGKLFVNEIVEDTKGILTYDEIGVSGLTNVTMTKAKSTTIAGGAIVSNTGASSGAFRISLPKAKLIANKDMVFSFNYRFITGSSLTVSDWCDGTATTKINNGCIKIQGSRSSYDDTYRFVDFNIGANTSFEMWNFRLYQGTLADTKSGVNKKGVLNTDEIIEVEDCSMKTSTELSANWVRVFYHNNNGATQFFDADKNKFLKCHDEFRQSDLWALEQFRGKDGKFELLLKYQNSSGYNRWKQSNNFTKDAIAGYEAVSCSWTSNYWGGLAPSSNSNTWVDGSPADSTWFYAIGAKKAHSGGIPNANGSETGWVEIWVRCDDMNLFRMIKNGKCKATEFIEI